MERKMLIGIKQRAEALASTATGASTPESAAGVLADRLADITGA